MDARSASRSNKILPAKTAREYVEQSAAVDAIEPRHVAENAATGKLHDRAHVIGIIVADENEAMKRHAPTVERLDREERVVDRPKGGPRAQDQRQAPVREYVDLQLAPGDRHQQPAGTLDDQHSIGRRHGQRLRLDLDTIQLGGAMRR